MRLIPIDMIEGVTNLTSDDGYDGAGIDNITDIHSSSEYIVKDSKYAQIEIGLINNGVTALFIKTTARYVDIDVKSSSMLVPGPDTTISGGYVLDYDANFPRTIKEGLRPVNGLLLVEFAETELASGITVTFRDTLAPSYYEPKDDLKVGVAYAGEIAEIPNFGNGFSISNKQNSIRKQLNNSGWHIIKRQEASTVSGSIRCLNDSDAKMIFDLSKNAGPTPILWEIEHWESEKMLLFAGFDGLPKLILKNKFYTDISIKLLEAI